MAVSCCLVQHVDNFGAAILCHYVCGWVETGESHGQHWTSMSGVTPQAEQQDNLQCDSCIPSWTPFRVDGRIALASLQESRTSCCVNGCTNAHFIRARIDLSTASPVDETLHWHNIGQLTRGGSISCAGSDIYRHRRLLRQAYADWLQDRPA